MKRSELLEYEQKSVRLDYNTDIGPQSRTGIIYAVGGLILIFWPFEEDKELHIRIKDVDKVKEIKGGA